MSASTLIAPARAAFEFHNRVAVVTGGARGIGLACVQRFLASGAQCAIWDLDSQASEAAITTLADTSRTAAIRVDLTDQESVHAAVRQTETRFGRIDILVNNAGIAGVNKKLWEFTPAEWLSVINVNLNGVFHCCRAVVPGMIARNYGRIVNIASIAGKEGNPNAAHYSASKAAVIGLTKSLGKELARSGVLVNCITPAVIDTEILKQCTPEHVQYMLSLIPMNRPGQVEEVAALVSWLSSDECSFSTGAVFDISGGRATY